MQLTDDLLMPLPEALHESSAQNEWDALKNSSSICQQTIQSRWQSFLLRLFTHETEEVFKTLRLSFEEQVKFDDVLKEIENCTFPRFLIIYNRFKLFTHEKEKDDTCEAYALQLKRLSQYCEFGEDSNGVLAKHIAKALNMNDRYTDFTSILEACRKQDKASSQSDCEGPTMPSDTCQLENLSATHVRKRKIPVHTNVHPVAEVEAKSKQVSEFSDYTNQRPKRKISVPARLQTDAVAMKLLKFTERRAVVEREKYKTMYEGKGHSMKQKQIKQKPTSSKVMTQDARNGSVGKEKLEMSDHPERGHDRKVKSPRVDEQYICTQCGGSFESKLALNRHLSLHKTEKKFTCRICLTGFACLKSLVDHKKVHAYSKSFKCEMCGKSFNHLVNLKCHLRVHTGEKPYQCPHCDQKFTWQAAKRRHVRRLHTGERPYLCEFCPKRFIDFSGWQNHTRTHTKEKPLTCNLCSFQTSTSASMAVHRRTHSGERPYQCKLCTKAFISSANLTVHMKSHHGRSRKSHYGRSKSKNVVCEVCGKRFQCPSNLKLHSRKHSGEKPYKCSTCGAMFGWYAAFKRHQRTHTKEKPYTCDICHRSFADKPYLSRHKLSHTGERPFKCEVCGKTFVVSHDLQDHVKIHSSDRKFVCEVCGMAFVRKCYLYKHKRVHFGIKTHQCETCGKKFFEPNKLRDHMQRHEKRKLKPPPGSKHHLCSTCGKVFAKKAYLVKHIMTHTGNKPYICDTCGAKFVDSFKLKRHKNIHNRRSRTSVPGKINSAEILALEQLGIQILTESASQGSQEQSKTVITAKEESLGQVTNNSISTQHIIVQQNEEDQKLEVPTVESQNNEQQQIIITQPETSELNQVMTDQPYEVIILEVW